MTAFTKTLLPIKWGAALTIASTCLLVSALGHAAVTEGGNRLNARLDELTVLVKDMRTQQKAVIRGARNPLAFCYADDKAYSEGARLDNRVCTRQAADKLEATRQRPLVWR